MAAIRAAKPAATPPTIAPVLLLLELDPVGKMTSVPSRVVVTTTPSAAVDTISDENVEVNVEVIGEAPELGGVAVTVMIRGLTVDFGSGVVGWGAEPWGWGLRLLVVVRGGTDVVVVVVVVEVGFGDVVVVEVGFGVVVTTT